GCAYSRALRSECTTSDHHSRCRDRRPHGSIPPAAPGGSGDRGSRTGLAVFRSWRRLAPCWVNGGGTEGRLLGYLKQHRKQDGPGVAPVHAGTGCYQLVTSVATVGVLE